MEIDDFLKHFESIEFNFLGHEFEYLDSTIQTLIKNYKKDFQKEDDKYKLIVEEMKSSGEYYEPLDEEHAPEMLYGEMMEGINLQEPFHELESFASIIIESLIIKHLAYIEDILIKLSFMVQKQEKQVIPPDYNISGAFTDMLKAVDYMQKVSADKVNIKNTKDWALITHLRTLRHQLAHGKRSFVLKEGIIDEINKKLNLINKQTVVIKKIDAGLGLAEAAYASQQNTNSKTEWHCSVNSDINVLIYINKICVDFVEDVKELYRNSYN